MAQPQCCSLLRSGLIMTEVKFETLVTASVNGMKDGLLRPSRFVGASMQSPIEAGNHIAADQRATS